MYKSPVNRFFYRFVRAHGLPYAVVSDRYGLHFADEVRPWYDVHPSQLTREDKRALGAIVRRKAIRRGFRAVVFYNNSPLMSVPYLEILSSSGLGLFFTTRLAFVEQHDEHQRPVGGTAT
jgi:hypothetical protein